MQPMNCMSNVDQIDIHKGIFCADLTIAESHVITIIKISDWSIATVFANEKLQIQKMLFYDSIY